MREAENEATEPIEIRNEEDDTVEEAKNEITEPSETRNNAVEEVMDNHNVRRSLRDRKQRIDINQEDIGKCDDKNDPDYN